MRISGEREKTLRLRETLVDQVDTLLFYAFFPESERSPILERIRETLKKEVLTSTVGTLPPVL